MLFVLEPRRTPRRYQGSQVMLYGPQIVCYATQVTFWRRLNRVVFEYPGGIIARWTIPNKEDINYLANQCAEDGMKLKGARGCLERWVR